MNKDKTKFLFYFMIIGLLVFFFFIESKGLNHVEPGDEHIYFYMGKMISQGYVPYKDFFHAHPPLKVYIIALVFKIFGFNLAILKLIPLLCSMTTAFFLFRLMKRFNGITALLSAFLFLFSFRVMLESTYFMGINLTAMFTVIGFYYFISLRYYRSGFFLAMAGLSGLYSLIPISVVFIYLLIKNRISFLKLLAGFSVFFAVNILFILLSSSYLTDVYLYHLLKPNVISNKIDVFIGSLKENWLIFFSSFLFIILLLISILKKIEIKSRKILYLSGIIAVLYIVFLLSLNKIFNYYFVLLFPFLAVIGSYSLYKIISYLIAKSKIIIIILILCSIFIVWNISADAFYLNRFDFDNFDNADIILNHIETIDGMLFGDDSIIPLIALMSNRDIALNMIDSNDMVFNSGLINLTEVLNKLKKEKNIIIVRPLRGIGLIEEMKSFVDDCTKKKNIKDSLRGDFLICQP